MAEGMKHRLQLVLSETIVVVSRRLEEAQFLSRRAMRHGPGAAESRFVRVAAAGEPDAVHTNWHTIRRCHAGQLTFCMIPFVSKQ